MLNGFGSVPSCSWLLALSFVIKFYKPIDHIYFPKLFYPYYNELISIVFLEIIRLTQLRNTIHFDSTSCFF